jgi:hypothetical protein
LKERDTADISEFQKGDTLRVEGDPMGIEWIPISPVSIQER